MTLFRHKHDHRPVAVEHRGASIFATVTARATVILFRCACGNVYSREIDGRWTLAQVRGEPEPEAVGAAEAVTAVQAATVTVSGTGRTGNGRV